jgi:hypothetical protein
MGIKILKLIGDSDLIMMQIKNQFGTKNIKLKRYRHVVWDSIQMFDAFSIEAVQREQNEKDDSLVVAAFTLLPCDDLMFGNSRMEILFRLSVADNYEHCQIFHDDAQVIIFLNNVQEFVEKSN